MAEVTFPNVIIYNDPSSGEQDADIESITGALQKQVDNDFGPAWHTGATLQFVPSTSRPPTGSWVIAVLDNSDQAGALGYHDLTPDGLPLGKVFAGTDRQNGQQVSVSPGGSATAPVRSTSRTTSPSPSSSPRAATSRFRSGRLERLAASDRRQSQAHTRRAGPGAPARRLSA